MPSQMLDFSLLALCHCCSYGQLEVEQVGFSSTACKVIKGSRMDEEEEEEEVLVAVGECLL